MAWPADQSSWNQGNIYFGYHSADPSPSVPLPQLPGLSWELPADGVHPWGCYPPDCVSCRVMSASLPSPRVVASGPNPDRSDHSDPTGTISTSHQPSVEGSIHQEPKSQSQTKKKNTRQTPEYGTSPSIPYIYASCNRICQLTISQPSFGCSPAMQVGRLPLFGLLQP